MNQTRARAALEDDVRNVLPLGSGSDFTVFLQRLGVSYRIRNFWGPSNVTNRSLVLIRLSLPRPLILLTTTTPSTTLRCGKRHTLTLVFIVM